MIRSFIGNVSFTPLKAEKLACYLPMHMFFGAKEDKIKKLRK
jgi:hypothetical protein